jgi:hypothetical protein
MQLGTTIPLFTPKKEAENSSEKLVNIYQTAWRHSQHRYTDSNAKEIFSVLHSVQTGSRARQHHTKGALGHVPGGKLVCV